MLALALAAGACGKKADDEEEVAAPAPPPESLVSPPRAPEPDKPLPAFQGEHQGKLLWARSIGGASQDEARGVDLDAKGNVAVAGQFVGAVDLGGGVKVDAAAVNGFVGLLDPKGKPRWMLPLTSVADVTVSNVVFDGKSNVIVVGWFSGTLGVGGLTVTAAGADDGFVAMIDPSGKPAWLRALGGVNTDILYGVDVDKQGGIAVIGEKRGAADFGGGELEAKGSADIFVVRLSPDGTHLWSRAWGDMGEDNGRAVAFDSRGDLLVAAEIGTPVDFGDGKLLAHKGGNGDIAVAKLDPAGRLVWARSFGGSFDDVVLGIAVDGADNVILCGSFEDRIKFGGDKLVAGDQLDAYVAKLNAAGEPQWARSYGADREDRAVSCAADRFGNVVVTGWFAQKVNFGGGPMTAPNDNSDGFLLKLSPAADHLWSRQFGDQDLDRGRAVAVDPEGNIALGGIYRFTLDLGGTTLESVHKPADKVAPADAFFARFGP